MARPGTGRRTDRARIEANNNRLRVIGLLLEILLGQEEVIHPGILRPVRVVIPGETIGSLLGFRRVPLVQCLEDRQLRLTMVVTTGPRDGNLEVMTGGKRRSPTLIW